MLDAARLKKRSRTARLPRLATAWRTERIKAYCIATSVFDRDATFDAQTDSLSASWPAGCDAHWSINV
jgi:hypothetical protein